MTSVSPITFDLHQKKNERKRLGVYKQTNKQVALMYAVAQSRPCFDTGAIKPKMVKKESERAASFFLVKRENRCV
jgi:hypothetical protein